MGQFQDMLDKMMVVEQQGFNAYKENYSARMSKVQFMPQPIDDDPNKQAQDPSVGSQQYIDAYKDDPMNLVKEGGITIDSPNPHTLPMADASHREAIESIPPTKFVRSGREEDGEPHYIWRTFNLDSTQSIAERPYPPTTTKTTFNYIRGPLEGNIDKAKSFDDRSSEEYKEFLQESIKNWKRPESGDWKNVDFNVTKNSKDEWSIGYGKVNENTRRKVDQ